MFISLSVKVNGPKGIESLPIPSLLGYVQQLINL